MLSTLTHPSLTRPASLKEWRERSAPYSDLKAESLRHGLTYQPQPSDLFISPFAKCGTTWLQQIVHTLRTGGDMDFDDISQVIPWLEKVQWIGQDMYAPQLGSFRAFKSHLGYQAIPKGGRYIVSFRDPKDALVSFFNFVDGWQWRTGSVTISEFARAAFLPYQGDRWEGSYWGHLISWWEARHNPTVLLLTFEGMKTDLIAAVETIAHFLEIKLDQPLLDLVVKQASFEFMATHKAKFSQQLFQEAEARRGIMPPSDTLATVNSGRVGDHRTRLPTDISAEMDTIWRETVEARVGLSSYQALRAAVV